MPGRFLNSAERKRLSDFPKEVAPSDLITFFTLSDADKTQIPVKSAPYNRLGFALQICTLRYLGFLPDNLNTITANVVQYVAEQLEVPSKSLSEYGQRSQTRSDHLQTIIRYLGFRKANSEDVEILESWLVARALEHDKPTLLFHLACERLFQKKILRLGVTTLERLVVAARETAVEETYRRLEPLLNDHLRHLLDEILVVDEKHGCSSLAWLQQGMVSNSPKAILKVLEKLEYLKNWNIAEWDLSVITPNRRKFLAQLARKSTNQALQRMAENRRYPILIAFLQQSFAEVTDELIDMFDRCLAQSYARAGRDLKEFRISAARETNEKLQLFQEIVRAILYSAIT